MAWHINLSFCDVGVVFSACCWWLFMSVHLSIIYMLLWIYVSQCFWQPQRALLHFYHSDIIPFSTFLLSFQSGKKMWKMKTGHFFLSDGFFPFSALPHGIQSPPPWLTSPSVRQPTWIPQTQPARARLTTARAQCCNCTPDGEFFVFVTASTCTTSLLPLRTKESLQSGAKPAVEAIGRTFFYGVTDVLNST
jgi:hypothetical protein